MEQKLFLVVSGDPSGDLHASNLIKALKRRDPSTRVAAVGGPLSRETADEFIEDLASRGVTGFWEPALKIGFLLKLAKKLKTFVGERRPTALICVDYYGFNRRILPYAKAAGIPAYYFVSPQVWAWKPGRIKEIAETVRRMLVIFPFEVEFYRKHGVEVTFVGHPLVEILKTEGPRLSRQEAARNLGLDPARRIVGLLPGSRMKEARRNLPPILGAARLLSTRFPDLQFLIPVATTLTRQKMAAMVDLPGVVLTDGDFYEAVHLCDAAIVSSGTATVETGLLGVPMVIVYRLHPLTYQVARHMTSLDCFGMVNLVAGRRIVAELIQADCTPERIASEMGKLLTDRVLHERTRRDLRAMKEKLGGEGAFARSAAIIAQELG